MSRYLLLDSGPLGIVTQPRISAEVVTMNHWLIDCLSNGDTVLVPAIVYYEIRRELLRARKASGLARLDAFVQIDPNRYLALSDEALRLAAELWAQARQQGRPTSSGLDLDIDVILAAQALALGVGTEVIVVTTNPRHLRQFVEARLWNEVTLP
ncbi:MAG: nuclease [Bryobacteraceae bacterium]